MVINPFPADRPRFLVSQRGTKILAISGYKFCVHYKNKMKTRWICSTHNSKGCKAMLFTFGNEILKIKNVHTHPPDAMQYKTHYSA
ncbi:hypothetical protein EVAR_17880_1 [Eumeta japonica]|uniref:FLYWCH-type domain-containing protein n=1 Tax=Eumeta variegata TaxID=151549 RepID=A0A4C1UZK6_EUMVA|nr:hypothetical protein EVAR_17880_1 [Eumeta japonica]